MNLAEQPVQTVTNTAYGNIIAKACITGRPFVLPEFTTLNERYNVLASQSIGNKNGKDFNLGYFVLGIRGSNANGTNSLGVTNLKVNQHSPIDGNVFTPVPLIARPLDNPLSNEQRTKYRMRVVEQSHDGTMCEFYYASLIDFTNYIPSVVKVTRDGDGNEVPNPYIPERDSLFNPQPHSFTSEGTTPVTDTYIDSTAILDCSLDRNTLNEITNACKMKYGDPSLAAPNEVGICFGIDVQADGQIAQGASIRYTEAMSLVIAHFITERDGRSATSNTHISLAFDHGASEPMLIESTSTTTP